MRLSNQTTRGLLRDVSIHLSKDSVLEGDSVLYAEYYSINETLVITMTSGKDINLNDVQLQDAAKIYDSEGYSFCQYENGTDEGFEWEFCPDQYFEGMSEDNLKELAIEYRESIKSK